LEFGKYSISSFEGNSSGLVFKFTVLSSELDTLPPGEYSYYVGQGADTWEMTPARTQNHTEPQKTLEKWLMVSGDYLYRNYSSLSKDEQTRYRYYITYYLLWQYGDLTLEELQQYALELSRLRTFSRTKASQCSSTENTGLWDTALSFGGIVLSASEKKTRKRL